MTFEEFLKIIAEISKYLAGGTVGGVLGYLLKTQIDHRLAIARNYETIRATEFNKAASEFRTHFVDEIYLLRNSIEDGKSNSLEIIDKTVLIKHNKAKIVFEPFLNISDLSAFNTAWDNYRNYYIRYHEYKTNVENVSGFSPADPETIKEICEFCLNHIEKLLSFAEPKIST